MNTKNRSEFRVNVPIAQVSDSPTADASCTSEALYGERVTLLETQNKWALVRQVHDSYEGFLKLDDLDIKTLSRRTGYLTAALLCFSGPIIKVLSHIVFLLLQSFL
jgi:hypothetical protein